MNAHGINAAVFIDRDNTLIANDGDLGDPQQVRLLRGAASAVASLKGLGYRIVVVTNQGGVARGKYGEDDVRAVHERISEVIHATTGLRIDRFYYCPFHPEGTVKKYRREHPWRKPQPGMLLEAARELDLDLSRCWMIGDQMRDVAAGKAAGVRTILLTGSRPEGGDDDQSAVAERAQSDGALTQPAPTDAADGVAAEPDFRCPTLTEAVRIIAQQRRPDRNADIREPLEAPRSRPRRPQTPAQPTSPVSPVSSVPTQSPVIQSPAVPQQTPATALRPAPASTEGFAAVPQVVSTASSETTDRPPDLSTAGRSTPSADETLRQILAELRALRDARGEFHFPHIAALVLMSMAVICLVAGLVTAQGDDGHFLRWMAASLVAELLAIAMLLLRPS